MSGIQLVPVKQRFTPHTRGKYQRLIYQFYASGENEMGVQTENLELTYLGLRSAVNTMGLKSRVYVQKQRGEIHLIRRG